jgi:cell division septation protein DedD
MPERATEPPPQLVAAAPPAPLVAVPPPQLVAAAPPTQLTATVPAPQPAAPASAQCHGSFIQVGAFSEPVRARHVIADLHALQAMRVGLAVPAEDHLARVRLGPIADPAAVRATLDRVKRFGFSEAFIVGPKKALPADC